MSQARQSVSILKMNEKGNVIDSLSDNISEQEYEFIKGLIKADVYLDIAELKHVIEDALEFIDVKGYCESEFTNPIMEKLRKVVNSMETSKTKPIDKITERSSD